MSPRRRIKRGSKSAPAPKVPTLGMRVKGGVLFDPTVNGFVVIVHMWDNVDARGEPEEWRYPEVFPTEEAALEYYKASIRPALQQMVAKLSSPCPWPPA